MSELRTTLRFRIASITAALLLATLNLNAASQWDRIGPTGGTVRALAISPGEPDVLLAGLWGFGVYRSQDGGDTWIPSSEGLGYTDMARLAVAPSDPRIVYATTMRGDFFVSTDRGRTWSEPESTWPPKSGLPAEISVDPADPSVVYAGARDHSGTEYRLKRSDDRGETWIDLEGPFAGKISAVVIEPDNPQIIFVAIGWTVDDPGSLVRSADGGATWIQVIDDQSVDSVAIDPLDPQRVLTGTQWGIAVSGDGGGSFRSIADSPGQVQAMVFDPGRPDVVWAAHQGGVARSDDRGETWSPVEGGEPVWPASTILVVDGDVLVGGENTLTKLIGLFRSPGGQGPWQRSDHGFQVGQPTYAAVELATDPPVLLVSSIWLYRSTDGGDSIEIVDLDNYGTGLLPAPSRPETVYMAGEALWRSDDAGVTWSVVGPPAFVMNAAVDPRNEDIVYVVAEKPNGSVVLFKSTDGGVNWDQVLGHRDMGWRTLALNVHDPEVVLVGGAHGMVRSADGGASWSTVEFFEGGISEGFYSIAFDPHTPGRVVAGGSNGSWFSIDGGVTWSDDVYPYVIPFRTAAHIFDDHVANTVYALDAFDLIPFQTDGVLGTYRAMTVGLPLVAVNCAGTCSTSQPVDVWNLGASEDGNALYACSEFGLFRRRHLAVDRVLPSVGDVAGGTEVTIVGEGFEPYYTWVDFGGRPAARTVIMSENVLVASTPPATAGPVDVTVTTSAGRVATKRSAFSYVAGAVVGPPVLDPQIQVVEAGETASLTISLQETPAADVAVELASSSASSLEVPNEVTVPAGQRSATFDARAITREPLGVWITATLPQSTGGASAGAQVIVADQLHDPPARLAVPGVASSQGAGGSFFRTSLWITNPGPLDTAVRLRFVPAVGQDQGGGAETVDLSVPALESVVFSDVLPEAFGIDQTFGTVIVQVHDGLTVPLVSARSYNDAGDEGTFGQYIEAVEVPETVGQGWWSTQVLVGLGGNSAARTNVGVQNLEPEELEVTLQVFDSDGTDIGTPVELTVPPLTMLQVNKVNFEAGAGPQRLFGVRVRASGRFFSYASKIDQETSDPVFIPSDILNGQTNPMWLDGIAVNEGAAGTFFRSSLVVANLSGTPVEVTARFAEWGRSMDNVGDPVPLASLDPYEMVEFDDVLTEVFGLSDVAGTLELHTDRSIVAWARTYNDAGEGGTYGQLISPIYRTDLLNQGGAVLHGLSQDGAFRTNLGIWSTVPTSLEATLYSSDGRELGSRTFHLDANAQVFVPKIAQRIGGAQWISGGFLRLVPVDPYSVYVWTSVIDNRSSDQTFIRALKVGR